MSLLRIFVFGIVLMCHSLSYANDKTATTILLFGDSIIAGYGLAKSDSLAVVLETQLQQDGYKVNVINGGVSGDTTSSGRSRLSWTLNKYQPEIVLLGLGGNDILRGHSPATTKQNVDAMLQTLKNANVTIIFTGVEAPLSVGLRYKKQFDAIYHELASKHDLTLHPFLLTKTFGRNALMQADQIHPTAKGVEVIANDIKGYLASSL